MVYVIWAALVVLLCATPFVDTLTALVTVVLVVDLTLLLALLAISLRRRVDAPVVTGAPPVG